MLTGQIQYAEIDLKATSSLLHNTPDSSDVSFQEVMDKEITEIVEKIKRNPGNKGLIDQLATLKKKKNKTDVDLRPVRTYSQATSLNSVRNTYELLEKVKSEKSKQNEENRPSERRDAMLGANNFAGNAQVQPISDNGTKKKFSRSELLDAWENCAPQITEDLGKKAVRIDIPLVNDIQSLVLRLNPDRSISASILASKEMAKLVKDNQDQLDRNLRHHQLSLKEFNTYHSELEFTNESGTRKGKKKKSTGKKSQLDLV